MGSKAKEIVTGNLRTILETLAQGESLEESESFRDVLSGLEFFLSDILIGKYPEWKYESLDGFHLAKASKIGVNQAELIGMCILNADQTLTPFHLRLKVAESKKGIEWLHCRLGENTEEGLLRIPYNSSKWKKYMYRLEASSIDWVYEVTIGDEEA